MSSSNPLLNLNGASSPALTVIPNSTSTKPFSLFNLFSQATSYFFPPPPVIVNKKIEISSTLPFSKNLLVKINGLTYPLLAQQIYSERRVLRQNLALTIVEKGKLWTAHHDWRQFALMVCPGIIRETTLEGGSQSVSTQASLRFVRSCLSGEGIFFEMKIPFRALELLEFSLNNFDTFLSYLTPSSDRLSGVDLKQRSLSLQKEIRQTLNRLPVELQCIYIPLGYHHGSANQGHALSCKIEAEKDYLLLTLFNLGNGVDLHPILNYTINEKQRSFAFFPIRVSKELFFGEIGMAMFCHLIRYMSDFPLTGRSYDSNDIYDIFLQLVAFEGSGEIISSLGPKYSEYAAPEQMAGNCPEIAVSCVINDLLISTGISKKEREKFFLNREFCALLTAHAAFVQNPGCHPSASFLLLEALQSIGTTILDLHAKNQLTSEEMAAAQASLHLISKTARETTIPQVSVSTSSVKPFGGISFEFSDLSSLSSETVAAPSLRAPRIRLTHMLSPPRFMLSQIVSISTVLEQWIETAESLPTSYLFGYISDCLRTLPIPTREMEIDYLLNASLEKMALENIAVQKQDKTIVKDCWETVPKEQITEILSSFETLLRLALTEKRVESLESNDKGCTPFFDQFLAIYTVYAIADKLARQCDENRLDGYSSPFFPPPFTFTPNGFTSLPIREDNERYSQIKLYFTGKKLFSDSGDEKKLIFPIAPELNLYQYYQEMLSGTSRHQMVQGRNHVEYLTQFMPQRIANSQFELLCSQWLQLLPPSVQSLYNFAFIAHLLFSAPNFIFPPKLVFTETSIGGKRGLKIENPFFIAKTTTSYEKNHFEHLYHENLTPKVDKRIYDIRFLAKRAFSVMNGIRFYVQDDFIDLFSSSSEQLTTNDRICYTLHETDRNRWKISERDLRIILYMLRRPNLSLWQALQLFLSHENYALFGHPGVQQALDTALFQPYYLSERLQNEPKAVMKAFRLMVKNGLTHYQNNSFQLKAILFLVRIGISFEGFVADDDLRGTTLASYRAVLECLSLGPLKKEERQQINMHRLYLELESRPADPIELFVLLFKVNAEPPLEMSETLWFEENLSRFQRKASYDYEFLLADQTSRNRLCNGIATAVFEMTGFPSVFVAGEWQGAFPEYHSGEIELNFFTGKVLSRYLQATLCSYKYGSKGMPYRDINDRVMIDKHGTHFWKDETKAIFSLDRKIRYCPVQEKWYEVLPNTLGQLQEQQIIHFNVLEIEANEQDFLCWYEFLPWMHYKDKDGVITTYDQITESPYMRIEKQHDKLIYTRLDQEGKPFPYKLANLSLLKAHDPLYQYTVRFCYPDQLICFIKEDSSERQIGFRDILELNFYRIKYLFSNDGNGLASREHPGYYLVASADDLSHWEGLDRKNSPSLIYEQVMKEINQFRYAFVLYNPEKMRWLLLFPKSASLKQKSEDFTKDILYTEGRWSSGYVSFDYDQHERELKPNTDFDRGYILLAHLLKAQRDYEKSYKYISRIRSCKSWGGEWINPLLSFTNYKDHSIASIVFNLRLFLHIVKVSNLLFEERLHSQWSSVIQLKQFFSWGMVQYCYYLNLLKETGFSRVPENMVISEGEKKILISAFREFYRFLYQGENWEEKWKKEQPILDVQYHLFFSQNRENTLLVPPQTLNLRPPIFSTIKTEQNFSNYQMESILHAYVDFHTNPSKKPIKIEDHLFPDYPIQLTSTAINGYFPRLYEIARHTKPNCLSAFDFTLQATYKLHRDCYWGDICDLLFFVRHFSDHFVHPDYSLEGLTPSNEIKYRPVLKAIAAKIKLLPKLEPMRWEKFSKRYLKHQIDFQPLSQIILSAALTRSVSIPTTVIPGAASSADINGQLKEVEREISTLFNLPYKVRGGTLTPVEAEEEISFILRKDCAKTLAFRSGPDNAGGAATNLESFGLLPETIMKQVVLKGNLGFIAKHRPMLTEMQMQRLCWLANEWYFARVQMKLKEDNATALFFSYDHQRYPEISYYYIKTGKFPRQHQLETFQWICDGISKNKNRYFQLPAGEGKTDLVIPLLNLSAKKWGLMAVTCVTQSIYPIDKENLHFNLRCLNEELGYLEVGMHMINVLTAQNLEFIFCQLKIYKSEGRNLIITRHTYDALYLVHELSCYKRGQSDEAANEWVGRLRWSQRILNFFAEECLLICDEAHRNADALTRAIFGVGELSPISPEESSHLLKLMKPLLDCYPEQAIKCSDGKNVAELLHLTESLEAAPTDQEIALIQKLLSEAYLKAHFPEINAAESVAFIEYLTREQAPQPLRLQTWGRSSNPQEKMKANLVALTGHFLLDLLPEIVKLRTNVDHCRSLYPLRRHDVPAHNKMASTAEYDNRYKTCVLSIKGNYARKPDSTDLQQLLVDLVKSNTDEQRRGFRFDETPSNLMFASWVKESSFSSLRLQDLTLSDQSMMERLIPVLQKSRELIEYFLTQYVFEGIGTPAMQLTCNTTAVFNGFRRAILFSATPLEEAANPRCFQSEDYLKDHKFVDNVCRKLQETQNRQTIILQTGDFFQQMKEKHQATFVKATVLIDPRGFFYGFTNAELAASWMAANESLQGVLYWSEQRKAAVDRDEKICLRLKEGKLLEFSGSNIKTLFESHNLDWENMKVGTIYDAAHTESSNILQKSDATALFFPWEGLTASQTIQAVMRLRGFLAQKQRIIWVIQENLARKIYSSSACDINEFFIWSDRNEREFSDKRIVVNSFQEIHHAVSRQARLDIIQAHQTDGKTVAAMYLKHLKGMVEVLPKKAYEMFGEHETLHQTALVLENYARQLYGRFDYQLSFDSNLELVKEVQEIIASVEKRISHMHANPSRFIGKQVEQHALLKTRNEREQVNERPRPLTAYPEFGEYGNMKIYHPNFPKSVPIYSVRSLFNSHYLSAGLYFTKNQIITGKTVETIGNPCPIIKPIHFFLILKVESEGESPKYMAMVESHEIVSTELDDMMRAPKVVQGLKHQAILVTAQGQLVQVGQGALEMKQDEVNQLLISSLLYDFVQDAALLEGRIQNPDYLIERIGKSTGGWNSFQLLWLKILKAVPNPENAQVQAFDALKKRYHQAKQLS